MIGLTIDGRETVVAEGTSILEAAQDLGIDVPTLCYDESLSVFGACRMCIVEIEGQANLKPACATACAEGMVVQTESEAVVDARRVLLDLLLSDHPLDCLTCEQAGACKLQDYCYRYGVDHSSFAGEQKCLTIDDTNHLIERDPNKCILCGKCVLVCEEVQGTDAISFVGRGFDAKVETSFEHPLDISTCRFCGQCVDMCPTGALTNVQLKGTRVWDRETVTTTCPFCGTGCNLELNVKDGKVVGVTAAKDAVVNQGALCVKGRFHTDLIYSDKRVTTPLIRRGGELQPASWDEALDLVASRLGGIRDEFGGASIGIFSSARCTNEDNWAMQRYVRAAIRSNNIDHCART